MLLFIVRRLGAGALLLFLIATATFLLLNLTGQDPARQIVGQAASAAQAAAKRQELGLDRPVLVRYGEWISRIGQGDLGTSWFNNQPVTALLAQAVPVTLSVVLGAMLVTSVLGALLGVLAAVRGGAVDKVLQVLSSLIQAIPSFLVSLVLVLVLAVQLGVLPATGYVSFTNSPSGWLSSIVLPVVSLALGAIASVAMQIRGSMLDVLQYDYVRTLRSRGLPTRSVLFRHALRNASPPAVTTLALMFIIMISGAVVVEKVFNIPGVGTQANIAAGQGDLPVVLGVVLLTVTMVVIVNLLLDLAQGWLNPKVRVA
ncbi:ABC transporter permease [Pseudarthrobacter sp. YAF2]|uniref:ABC transporter permease n=1 Tax=Pseudarthrobacter sp. YAF2 TaxID=3233078 RepID=UPI003F954649